MLLYYYRPHRYGSVVATFGAIVVTSLEAVQVARTMTETQADRTVAENQVERTLEVTG